jgi:hypothetical protein
LVKSPSQNQRSPSATLDAAEEPALVFVLFDIMSEVLLIHKLPFLGSITG